ncbi:MAG: Ig-like domain-containing protein [Gemmatimonadales bacterium]|nr:MAG: Ig-like domain-containing protein [Gemmatimonadales bacterium]
MKKLYRMTLFAGVLAFGVAACGDDVQVVESDPPPPPALSVSLTPQAQTVAVGDQAVFAVGISGGATGAETTVTCASSNTSVASVSSSDTGCTVTGAAAGQASITVTVTRGNQTSNAGAQVTVVEDTVTQATVSISSLTQQNVTADISDIQGQLDVTMNVNPNDETLQELRLKVDGEMVASQVFTQAELAELAETAEAQQQITLSFNTARYDVDSTAYTAAPRHQNGERIISASLHVVERPAEPTASNEIAVEFNNADGFHVWAENYRDQANAMDSQGRVWYGGPGFELMVRPIPVLYSGRELANVTVSLTATGSGVGSCGGSQTASSSPFSVTFGCVGTENTGIVPVISSQFADTGDTGPSASVAGGILNLGRSADHPFPARIDVRAPQGGSIQIVSQNGNRENWINADYSFALTGANGFSAPSDNGVGGVANELEILDGSTVIEADELENSVTNTRYRLRVITEDALGNSRTVNQTAGGTNVNGPASVSHTLATFGFDDEAPTFEVVNGPANAAQLFVQEVPGSFIEDLEFRSEDVVSGFAPPAIGESLVHTLIHITPTAQNPTGFSRDIVLGQGSGTPTSTPFAVAGNGNFVTTPVIVAAPFNEYVRTPTSLEWTSGLDQALTDAGYYIYQAQIRDKAGNRTSIYSFMAYVNENNDPEITGLSPASFYEGGATASFTAVAQDAVEVANASLDIRYENIGRLVYDRNPGPVGTPFTDFIEIPNAFTYEVEGFLRNIQYTGVDNRATAGVNRPTQVNARVYNAYGDHFTGAARLVHRDVTTVGAEMGVSDFFSVPLLSSTIEAAPSMAFSDEFEFFIETSPNRIVARGPTGTFTNPFDAVVVVARFDNGTTLEDDFLVITATAGPTFDAPFPSLDNGVIRDFIWTFPAGALAGADAIHGVGIRAGTGDALATQPFAIGGV